MILEASLAKFASSRDEAKRSVILEVKSPPVSIASRFGGRSAAPRKRVGRGDGSFAQLKRALAALKLSSPPVLLEDVGIAVVEVTGEQLAQLAQLPMLEAIRPNRTHRAPRTGLSRSRR